MNRLYTGLGWAFLTLGLAGFFLNEHISPEYATSGLIVFTIFGFFLLLTARLMRIEDKLDEV